MSIKNEILELIQIVLDSEETPNPENYIDILKKYLYNEKNANEIISEVIYSLKEQIIDMSQLVAEEVSLGNGRELIDDKRNNILLYILKLNEVIQTFEDYSNEIIEDNQEFTEENSEIFSPKIAIFSNAAINELKSIPDEEKASFSVPIGYIKNGGAKLNIGVKIISTMGGGKKILEYRNPTSQARIFAYKIAKNLIYVVKIVLKKDDWSKVIRKSICEKKPDRAYINNVRKKLGTKEGLEELKTKSENQLEEILNIIGVSNFEETADCSNTILDAIYIINELLKTNLSIENFESNQKITNSIYERIYYVLDEIEEIDDITLKYEKMIQMEKIMLDLIREYLSTKHKPTNEEQYFQKARDIEKTDNTYEMNKRLFIAERRILYMLNYLKEKDEELTKVEKQLVLSR